MISSIQWAASCLCLLSILLSGSVANGQSAVKSSKQQPSDESDFEMLFDGTDLSKFRGYKKLDIPGGWKVEDKTLVFDASGRGDIMTKEMYENFELRFDWKVSKGANSGVMYRVTPGDGAPYISGPEYQILDDAVHRDGKNPKTSAAAIYAMVAPAGKKLKPVGEWNSARIMIHNNRLEHWLNGARVAASEIGSEQWKQLKNASKFKTWKKFGVSSRGHIAFQDHGDKVWYRNIRIRKIEK